jgi:hypothetical protein
MFLSLAGFLTARSWRDATDDYMIRQMADSKQVIFPVDTPPCSGHNQHMIRLHTYLPAPVIDKLRELAAITGISVAEHIRRALDAYLRRERKP